MTFNRANIAMMAEMPLQETAKDAGAPAWVHLLPNPADGQVHTGDARGPYTLSPFAEIITNTFSDRDAIEIDVNHATFLAAPKGGEARAVGWIREMQAREDGLWGRVEWTAEGEELVAGRAYRGISPVVLHPSPDDKRISRLANASLVNRPNLKGLTQLHQQETQMSFMQRMAKLLGLKDDATEDAIASAMEKALKNPKDGGADTVALQSTITNIGDALGVKDGDAAAVLAAAQEAANPLEITALQSEITGLTVKLNTLTEDGARDKATTYVDAEIKRGRAGLRPVRDRYIEMHMSDAEGAIALIEAMPVLSGTSITTIEPPKGEDGVMALNAEQMNVANQFGWTADEYREAMKADQVEENA